MPVKQHTLCWDCKKAVLGCSWALEFIPIKGWTAEYIPEKDSYCVKVCPEFLRDAYRAGLIKLSDIEEHKKKKVKNPARPLRPEPGERRENNGIS